VVIRLLTPLIIRNPVIQGTKISLQQTTNLNLKSCILGALKILSNSSSMEENRPPVLYSLFQKLHVKFHPIYLPHAV
jgi:hypothetical protein